MNAPLRHGVSLEATRVAQEDTVLSPRFYTTDFDELDKTDVSSVRAQWDELIVELRSATAGAGSFTRAFDRMAEVTGRAADQIIAAHRVAA